MALCAASLGPFGPLGLIFDSAVVRALWPIIVRRINMAFIWYHNPRRREFVRKASPLGANPFDLPVVYRTTVGFSDLDYNIHLSNSSYAKVCTPSHAVIEARGGPASNLILIFFLSKES